MSFPAIAALAFRDQQLSLVLPSGPSLHLHSPFSSEALRSWIRRTPPLLLLPASTTPLPQSLAPLWENFYESESSKEWGPSWPEIHTWIQRTHPRLIFPPDSFSWDILSTPSLWDLPTPDFSDKDASLASREAHTLLYFLRLYLLYGGADLPFPLPETLSRTLTLDPSHGPPSSPRWSLPSFPSTFLPPLFLLRAFTTSTTPSPTHTLEWIHPPPFKRWSHQDPLVCLHHLHESLQQFLLSPFFRGELHGLGLPQRRGGSIPLWLHEGMQKIKKERTFPLLKGREERKGPFNIQWHTLDASFFSSSSPDLDHKGKGADEGMHFSETKEPWPQASIERFLRFLLHRRRIQQVQAVALDSALVTRTGSALNDVVKTTGTEISKKTFLVRILRPGEVGRKGEVVPQKDDLKKGGKEGEELGDENHLRFQRDPLREKRESVARSKWCAEEKVLYLHGEEGTDEGMILYAQRGEKEGQEWERKEIKTCVLRWVIQEKVDPEGFPSDQTKGKRLDASECPWGEKDEIQMVVLRGRGLVEKLLRLRDFRAYLGSNRKLWCVDFARYVLGGHCPEPVSDGKPQQTKVSTKESLQQLRLQFRAQVQESYANRQLLSLLHFQSSTWISVELSLRGLHMLPTPPSPLLKRKTFSEPSLALPPVVPTEPEAVVELALNLSSALAPTLTWSCEIHPYILHHLRPPPPPPFTP